mgnify:FL=1
MKIIHTADLHLDSPINGLPSEKSVIRRKETVRTFGKIVEIAEKTGAEVVIIAGDLFDSEHVTKSTAEYVLDRIKSADNILFCYLPGNHDEKTPFIMTELPDNLIVMDSENNRLSPGENLTITAFADCRDFDAAPPFDKDSFNIVIYHGDIAPIVSKAEGKNIDYLALGHYHKRDFGYIGNRGIWLYPGCPNGRGFDECGEKGAELIDINGKEFEHCFIPTCDRIYHDIKLDISGLTSSAELAAEIKDATNDIPDSDLARIELVGKTNADFSIDSPIVHESLERLFGCKLIDNSEIVPDKNLINEISLKGEFARLAENGGYDSEIKNLILRYGFAALSGEEFPE